MIEGNTDGQREGNITDAENWGTPLGKAPVLPHHLGGRREVVRDATSQRKKNISENL